MYTLLVSKSVKCFACEKTGKSRISLLYRLTCLLFLGGTYLTHKSGVGFPIGGFPVGDLGWLIPGGVTLALFLAKNAHSCRHCGSQFVSKAR